MKFAIRDDDTNYFTNFSEIVYCYEDIWDLCPITLAVVPYIKGNWKYWINDIEKNRDKVDWSLYRKDDKIYKIGDNEALVTALYKKISENKLDIAIHGIEHRNPSKYWVNIEGNYVHGAEFNTNIDLTEYLRDAKFYLELLFKKKVKVFTPPQNLMSYSGYKSVSANNLNINTDTPRIMQLLRNNVSVNSFLKYLVFKVFNKSCQYPFVINHKNFKEISHVRLQPSTTLQSLIDEFERIKSINGDFVLSTHYYAFNYEMLYDSKLTMKMVFYKFMDYVKQYDVKYCTLSNIFEQLWREESL